MFRRLSSRRQAFLPCLLPASRSTNSFSQPDCFVLLGPGDPRGGGRVQQRQLPGLRRPFPDRRPGATFITSSAADLSKLLKMDFFRSCFSPGATHPGSTPATLPASRAGLQGWKPGSLSHRPHSLRHSSSPAQAQHMPRVQADPCS